MQSDHFFTFPGCQNDAVRSSANVSQLSDLVSMFLSCGVDAVDLQLASLAVNLMQYDLLKMMLSCQIGGPGPRLNIRKDGIAADMPVKFQSHTTI